ncbi:MAG: methyltransferase domain-containing protein [Anaerolineales bacterium]|nr:methyltransferase domain-containing protein [Anaerolineales bacterium]
MLHFIQDVVPHVTRYLDIGSSSGALLATFAKAYQCDCIGVEPGDAYRSYTRDKGLSVFSNLGALEEIHHQAFDFISMSHVLEHLPDPLSYLRRLRQKWLTPQGFLLLEVPSLFGHQSLEVSHLTAFTASTLKEMLRQAGFEILRTRHHGRPRSRLIPLYLTVLARASRDPVSNAIRSSSLGVRWGRRLGSLWRRLTTVLVPGWAWLPWPEMEEEQKAFYSK